MVRREKEEEVEEEEKEEMEEVVVVEEEEEENFQVQSLGGSWCSKAKCANSAPKWTFKNSGNLFSHLK